MTIKSPSLKTTHEDPGIMQARAADPQQSVWVGASAGTGKTKVLIDRLLRLMLPTAAGQVGTRPDKILCLTFTKTAAAEMSARIFSELAKWSVAKEEDLSADLLRLTGAQPDKSTLDAARRLFARVLDVPGGLRIMTIHSFCQSMLKRFPVEANLTPQFLMLDDSAADEILTECLHDLIADCARQPESVLAKSFQRLTLVQQSSEITALLREMMAKRSKLEKIFTKYGDVLGKATQTVDAVYAALGISRDMTMADIDLDIVTPPDEETLRDLACAMIEHGTDKTGKPKGRLMVEFLSADVAQRLALKNEYISLFITGEGTLSKILLSKNVTNAAPETVEIAQGEGKRLIDIIEKMNSLQLAEMTTALLTLAADMLGRYHVAKRGRDALDFEDLILEAARLLAAPEDAQWVHYKLDEGIDHILVDEAQDTSPAQWQVIRALAEEFFAGQGIRDDITRTLFVVGDEKQSIFSFQGADPAAFHRMKRFFAQLAEGVQDGFAVDLAHSFRSAPSVLELVDAVFNDMDTKRGVVAEAGHDVVHIPFRAGAAGHVELWPLYETAKKEDREDWAPPTEVEKADNAQSRLVADIVATIKGWLERGEMLPSRGRPIRAGDVMILVQSRGALVATLQRALKSAGVPVAGTDRLYLGQEIAIMDLLAAAHFALQPRDDLTLAALLKSPLVGMDEQTLFDLCHGRAGQPLWQRLHDRRADLVDWLQPLIATAGRATPYEFFASLLARPCPASAVSGRRAFYARLGRDIADALDEFLSLALSYEQNHLPALQAFVDYFRDSEAEIKREQDAANLDQVRIMTVHASKGLQAPIVFLPDAGKIGYAHNKARVRFLWPEKQGEVPLWIPSSAYQNKLFKTLYQEAEARQGEEYRRLLYVALTRAEDRLYIAASRGKNSLKDTCWYEIVRRCFPARAEKDDSGRLILANAQTVAPPPENKKDAVTKTLSEALPDWLGIAAKLEAAPSKPLAPSRPGEDEPAAKSPLGEDDSAKFRRGVIMHRVLELLPQVPRGEWPARLATYLARPALALSTQQQKNFADEIMEVLTHPDFAPIFGAGSRAEVPLVGLAGASSVLSGQIDRLCMTPDSVLVVDYKTNRPPPVNVADVPPIYRKQMAAYVAVLRRIYPRHTIKCALLWTDGPRLMPLPDELLAPYLPKD